MNTDYTEFIERHSRKTAVDHSKPKTHNHLHVILLSGIVLLYFVTLIYIVHLAHIDESTIVLAVIVFIMACALAYVTRRTQSLQRRQEKELILLNEVFEGSRGGRLIADSADNTLYCNHCFKELCASKENDTYQGLLEMFSGNDQAESLFMALSDGAHRGLADSIELYCGKQDYEGWYVVSAEPVTGHAGFIHWRIDNVTERHTADRDVREEREKLIDFTDNAPVGFYVLDEKGKFIFANATLARWLGVDIKKLLDKGRLHTYLEKPPKKAKPYDLTEKGGDKQLVEVEMKGAGGKTFLASINHIVIKSEDGTVRTRAVVHDLTSEREMRRALKASEDRFQQFYEEAPLGIVLVGDDGLIEDCNNQFAGMMGQKREKLENKHFKLLISDKDRDRVLDAMKHMQEGEPMDEALEVMLQGKGKSEIIAQLHARRLTGGSTVLHFIDVTEKRALERQFVQSQKMQAVGQLAGGIAHDFNNLLTAIIGFCDLLLLRHKPGDPSFGDIMQIKQNSNRASNLVRQLLAFSRQQTLRPRVHDITDILTELSHLIRRLVGANITLDITHGSDLGLVKVDEGQMEQVLINLVVNARDAMKEVGHLTITSENFTNREELSVVEEEMPPGHWILIKVSDTGCGISKENISRILEPFFTTKDVGEGTGLGLATVYGIIRQTGGYLDIESTLGKGTTFSIYLPRISESEEEEEEERGPGEEDSAKDLTGSERILLVEDEAAVRIFAQRALVNKGYKVISAESGDLALELLEEEDITKIDLLITDVVMPGIDGPVLAQRIRQDCPNLKIIFISGYTEDKLKEYTVDDNTYFLPKPFTLKVLAAKVKEVLEG